MSIRPGSLTRTDGWPPTWRTPASRYPNGTTSSSSGSLYFDVLQLERLVCEPNAFNVAPNRTLQRAGFRYDKTHMTVPGGLNYHQAVTRWVLERDASRTPHGYPASPQG